MLAAILQAGGHRVGLYTSPHLCDFRERIRVQGEDIAPEQVCELTRHLTSLISTTAPLTFFEMTTAMAFQHFYNEKVDVAIIEVGMGGRFDATNVLDPLGVLITGIAFDHEKYLGHSLEAIAYEKAGIIRQSSPVVVGSMAVGPGEVIEQATQRTAAPLYRFGKEYSITILSDREFDYQGVHGSFGALHTNLLGFHQMENAANMLALWEVGGRPWFPIVDESIRKGLKHVGWKGRMEIVQEEPLIILDGAHNLLGAQILKRYLEDQRKAVPGRKIILVIGMMADKDVRGFLRVILPIVDRLIFTKPDMRRGASPKELTEALPEGSPKPLLIPNSWEAICQAKDRAAPSDLICVTGSLFLVGEVSSCFTGRGVSALQV